MGMRDQCRNKVDKYHVLYTRDTYESKEINRLKVNGLRKVYLLPLIKRRLSIYVNLNETSEQWSCQGYTVALHKDKLVNSPKISSSH